MGDGKPASAAAGRHGRRLRVRLREWRRSRRLRDAYRRWLVIHEDREEPLAESRSAGETTTFSVLVPCVGVPWRDTIRTILSVCRQSHRAWEVCIAADGPTRARARHDHRFPFGTDARIRLIPVADGIDPAAAVNEVLPSSEGRFVIHLPVGGQLAPQALAAFAAACGRHPGARILYADDDRVDWLGRRCDPVFKSEFNHVMLFTHDCLSHPLACDRDLATAIGGWNAGCHAAIHHDFVLRAVEQAEPRQIVHVPAVLHHRRAVVAADATAAQAGREAVARHLARLGVVGSVEPAPEASGRHRVRLAVPSPAPLVSVVICTRDNPRLLARCIATIRGRTRYPAYEIILVDNGSRDATTIDLIAGVARQPGVLVIRDDDAFNFSRLNNAAVARARGGIVCLLNDDTEVLAAEWLDEMVGFAMLDGVGAVGARLWYPDGTLQHGGVVLDRTVVATHAFARYPHGDAGYGQRAIIQRDVSAVTAACLVVRRDRYEAVGGLDERLAVAFNDVDLCLRLREQGWRTVWTPYAELIHHESVSRGRDVEPERQARFAAEAALMRERWGDMLARDPCYSPWCSSHWADWSIAPP